MCESKAALCRKNLLCLWEDSAASDLCAGRFDCDKKRDLSAAGTWMTAMESRENKDIQYGKMI